MAMPNPYFGFRKDRSLAHRLWERFNCGLIELDEIRDPYQRALVDDWQRCAALGIDVAMRAGVRLSDDEHRHAVEDAAQLLDRARPAIAQVSACLFDVPGILILTNGAGTILHVEGDARVKAFAAERSGIVEGSCWLESVAGTNGLGSAIRKRAPVHVYSAEHFCEGWHDWTCAATPIAAPGGGDIVGVIDFTTIEMDYRDQAVALTTSLANSIRAGLALDHELERSYLLQRYAEHAQRYPDAGLVALDRRDGVVRANDEPRARRFAARSPIERSLDEDGGVPVPVVLPTTGRRVGSLRLFEPARAATARPAASAVGAPLVAATPEVTAKGEFLTTDPATIAMLDLVERAARRDAVVLVVGETGTGKELIARYLHARSPRARAPYVAVNCGAISSELMASSFFGYVGGAFTGADPKGRKGYFEAAGGGTLFLDEIGELPLEIQAALLRVLEDRSVQKIGADRPVATDCRIIAATNRDLGEEAARGSFRRDLFYRLDVVRVALPPLRARPGDILMLARRFVERFAEPGRDLALDPAAEARLLAHDWPGNVRELRNVIEAATIRAGERITADDLAILPAAQPGEGDPEILEQRGDERGRILAALVRHRKVGRAAQALGMSRATLYRKFALYGIDQRPYL